MLITLAGVLALTPLIAGAATPTFPAPYVESEVIVTFKPAVDLTAARASLTAHSLTFARHFGPLSQKRGRQTGLLRDPKRSTATLVAELAADPAIETAEPNYLRYVTSPAPNDPLFAQLWGLQNTGQSINGTLGIASEDVQFVPAWALARPNTNPVVVAVIDTGVDYTHPDLASNVWVNPGEIPGNGVDDDADGYVDDVHGYNFADGNSDPTDAAYHGTHVAGTIAALGYNHLGVIGVNYQAQIMALRASSDGNTLPSAAVIEAVQYATLMKNRGINVVSINASFGGGGSSTAESAVIQAAGDAGIIFCAAAGNDAADNDTSPHYPASYRLANMIVVAASGQNGALASFSDYGATTVDLAAPGVNILSTKPLNIPTTVASLQQGATSYAANPLTFSPLTAGITGTLVDCRLGNPAEFPAAVSNQIALISRGTLQFSAKVGNAITAGARAVVIYNNVAGNFTGTLQFASNWVPAISISQADGLALKNLLPATGTVVCAVDPTQSYQFLDGTSMATPHVSGAVAFVARNFPAETVAQRISRILTNVDVLPALQGRLVTGGRLNLLRTVDADANGLPDWWELQYFGALTGTNPNGDADHDGASNLAEWLAGTNPTDAASALRLLISRPNPTNTPVLQWPSVAGKFYSVQRATNLAVGFDTTVQSAIAATPPTNTMADPAGLPNRASYYLLRLEP